ncbi:glycosyl hydrolases family 15-domain-containing protein [Geranomyces variabilis]|nr:glycosyl hydrolases family 15-domain-containing protein [Geranomyces variabilis]
MAITGMHGDNVYTIFSVWGLALAYRRIDDDEGRGYELEHATIKTMRGLLSSMMRQANKVEQFKNNQAVGNALHAKYNTQTGGTVVGDNEWGHLQIDATSIFLLALSQMTACGMQLIYTMDEVHFIQNLVFYIERAYRTPDFGVWERGNKVNHGEPELNSSSIGMVVAALQSINGINLFGSRGGPASVIHVLPDEMTRNYTTLHSALPRESASKEVDAALLSVISFPAFAVHDPALVTRTRNEIVKKLGGNYGFKRFLRDGHQTVLENVTRLHYDPAELKIFEDIESEWPLFYTYMILDGLFREDHDQVEEYRHKLDPLVIDSAALLNYNRDHLAHETHPSPLARSSSVSKRSLPPAHMRLVPELFIVPRASVEAERKNPGSQQRVPNENVPLVWAQSLYILGNLIYDDLLSPSELDPLGRRLASQRKHHSEVVVQVVLLAEDEELQDRLRKYGLDTQIAENCSPITISPPSALRDAYTALGENTKLGLTGRPKRPIGTLSTCKLYRCQGRLYAFTPHFMDKEEFYLVSDNDYLVSLFEQELSFVRNHWFSTGRPTMTVMLTREMLGGLRGAEIGSQTWRSGSAHSSGRNLLNFMMSLRSGNVGGVRIRLGRLGDMINTACISSLDFLVSVENSDYENWDTLLKGEENDQDLTKLSYSPRDTEETSKDRIRSASMDKRRQHHVDTRHRQDKPSEDRQSVRVHSPEGSYEDIQDQFDREAMGSSASLNSTALLTLTLNDPKRVPEAVKLLESSSNLYDQVDLLHYIHSCNGLDYEVGNLGSVSVLLEEVYLKAMHLRQWSIVRQAAGLLKKMVNSLTINVADLLIRQRPVTVGFGTEEMFITSPMPPAALKDLIYKHCASDVREAPLVQEILTYLGSFIRGTPALFEGIMRIRTHFFIIAIREEISRMKGCNEEEAVEQLMQLSPFEMKSLLGQILAAHDSKLSLPASVSGRQRSATSATATRGALLAKRARKRDLRAKLTLLERRVDLGATTAATQLTLCLPSQGRWLRRRKNDGALNRVPPDFYPKVWKVLSRSEGILVGKSFLASNPTIYEKTAEELNFALQVESLLDVIRDPAERQAAAECLMLISRIEERNPKFWEHWTSEHSNASSPVASGGELDDQSAAAAASAAATSTGTAQQQQQQASASLVHRVVSNIAAGLPRSASQLSVETGTPTLGGGAGGGFAGVGDWSFERHERVARRLFFDLPQEGR